jgi:Cyclopropane fatty acid synthase and related methyltransferases
MTADMSPALNAPQRALLAELGKIYGPRYNDGTHPAFESGYARAGHWENVTRWRMTAIGVVLAARHLEHPLLRRLGLSKDALAPGDVVGGRVLDLGCGRGVLVDILRSEHHVDAFGCDLGQDVRSAVGSCVVGNAALAPFARASFEVIVALDIIEHLPVDVQPSLQSELDRILAPGGLILATVPTKPPHFRLTSDVGPRNHYLCVSPAEWRSFFESYGWQVAAEGRDFARFGTPWTYGADNHPFALRRNT